MSRMALAATSLVAAIPAGILCVVALLALVNSAEAMSIMLKAVTGGATAAGLLIAIMPVAIALKNPAKPKKAKPAKGKKEDAEPTGVSGAQTAEVVAEDFSEVEEDEDTEAMSGADDLSGSTGEFQFEDDAFEDDEENA